MEERARVYLDYLEKEMTLMGVLPPVCLAVVAAVFKAIGDAKLGTPFGILAGSRALLLVIGLGTIATLLAAACFFGQRTEITWLHGDIARAAGATEVRQDDLDKLLDKAHTTEMWRRYRQGQRLLGVGVGLFLLSFLVAAIRGAGHAW